MASLEGAVTVLGLTGTPTRQIYYFDDPEAGTSPRPDDGQFTRLSLSGVMQRPYGDFDTKSEVDFVELSVSDTLSANLTEGPVDGNELTTYETLSVSLTEVATLVKNISVNDTLALSIGEVLSLVIAGVIEKSASDTLTADVTDASVLDVTLAVSDSLIADISDASDLQTSALAIEVSDTLTIEVSEDLVREIFAGNESVTAADSLALSLSEVAVVARLSPSPGGRRRIVIHPRRMRTVTIQ